MLSGMTPRGLMLLGRQAAEQTVGLAIGAGRKVQCVDGSAIAAVAEPEGPQSVDNDRLRVRLAHLADKFAVVGIEGIDLTIAKISDPQRTAQFAEIGRCERHTPGRVELVM